MSLGFREKLKKRQEEINSLLCVGLDPLPEKLPQCIQGGQLWERVFIFLREIVDATAEHASMFKPQKAHYEAIPNGDKALQQIINYIHDKYPAIPIFLDCKRGDIDRTQERYRVAHFEIDGADGINFNPYMGKDCLEKLVDKKHLGRSIVGLCYTSNKSARETQDVKLADGRYYWEFIAERTLTWAEECGVVENAGLVMAAAYMDEKTNTVNNWHLKRCREIVGDKLWFLMPGVGTQGGLIKETVDAAFAGYGSIAINSSSGIIFASLEADFAEKAGIEANKLKMEMKIA